MTTETSMVDTIGRGHLLLPCLGRTRTRQGRAATLVIRDRRRPHLRRGSDRADASRVKYTDTVALQEKVALMDADRAGGPDGVGGVRDHASVGQRPYRAVGPGRARAADRLRRGTGNPARPGAAGQADPMAGRGAAWPGRAAGLRTQWS